MNYRLLYILLKCKTLTPKEIVKILIKFTTNLSYKECAIELNVKSKQNVQQTVKRGLKKLKEYYKNINYYDMLINN